MKIGIIVQSRTGNTLSVAEKLKEKLASSGHRVNIERLKVLGDPKVSEKDVKFENLPDTGQYDALIFGSAVEAFSLSAVMKQYLEEIGPLSGKKAACLVTKQLTFKWTGGTHAVSQMKKLCLAKGAEVLGSGIVVWGSSKREENIDRAVDSLSGLF